jgi:hypothetical protein
VQARRFRPANNKQLNKLTRSDNPSPQRRNYVQILLQRIISRADINTNTNYRCDRREQETLLPTMTSTVTMDVKEDRADLSKKAAARKNSIDDAIKRTIPVVDAEQAVSFWPKERP